MARGRGFIPAALLVFGMVGFAVPWRALSGDEPGRPGPTVRCALPPGHPVVACNPTPERDPIAGALPPGHPPVQGRRPLPPGHPPIGDSPAARPGVITPTPLGGGTEGGPRVYAL
jgi:hypothetical protein